MESGFTMNSEIHELLPEELARLIASRQLSPVEVTQAMVGRIEDLNDSLHAYLIFDGDAAIEQARRAETEICRGQYRSSLHGLPFALKDNIDTTRFPTTNGMGAYKNNQPTRNATIADELERAGAVLLGKLALTEGAAGGYHPDVTVPVNPWGEDLWTGISSSGCASATSAGMCAFSIGTDTGGSNRHPAAACNLVGVNPGYGRVSLDGIFPLMASRDVAGPIVRSAAGAAMVMDAIVAFDARDPVSVSSAIAEHEAALKGVYGARSMRIGVDRRFNAEGTSDEVHAFLAEAEAVFRDLGARFVDVALPDMSGLRPVGTPTPELFHSHRHTYPSQAEQYGAGMKAALSRLDEVDMFDFIDSIGDRERFKRSMAELWGGIDLLLLPVGLAAGATIAEAYSPDNPRTALPKTAHFTSFANAAGAAAISFPAGFTAKGSPAGLQFVAPGDCEPNILRAIHAYQQVTSWHCRTPSL